MGVGLVGNDKAEAAGGLAVGAGDAVAECGQCDHAASAPDDASGGGQFFDGVFELAAVLGGDIEPLGEVGDADALSVGAGKELDDWVMELLGQNDFSSVPRAGVQTVHGTARRGISIPRFNSVN